MLFLVLCYLNLSFYLVSITFSVLSFKLMIDGSNRLLKRPKRSVTSKEHEIAASTFNHGSLGFSQTYQTKSNDLVTKKPEAESVKGKRKKVYNSRIQHHVPITECKNPRQCCCKEKGVIDVCWGYCVDVKEYSSRSFGVVRGICQRWLSLINYCIYCYKPGRMKNKINSHSVDIFFY